MVIKELTVLASDADVPLAEMYAGLNDGWDFDTVDRLLGAAAVGPNNHVWYEAVSGRKVRTSNAKNARKVGGGQRQDALKRAQRISKTARDYRRHGGRGQREGPRTHRTCRPLQLNGGGLTIPAVALPLGCLCLGPLPREVPRQQS